MCVQCIHIGICVHMCVHPEREYDDELPRQGCLCVSRTGRPAKGFSARMNIVHVTKLLYLVVSIFVCMCVCLCGRTSCFMLVKVLFNSSVLFLGA